MGTVGDVAWVEAHGALTRLAKTRAFGDYEEACWLVVGLRTSVHAHVGYASYLEYLHRLFGYGLRFAAERLRVARALEELPATAVALRDGVLCWSIVRELTRVAIADTEEEWILAAKGRSAREIEALVAGREPGSRPGDPVDPRACRHRVPLELSADAYALFREMRAELGRRTGGHLDDDALVMLMARAVLGGPSDEGRASYQISLTVCERCGAATQDAAGEVVPVAEEHVELAGCDAQVLDGNGRATQSIPPAIRRAVMRRDHGRCVIPGCSNAAWVDVHHVIPRSEVGPHDPESLAVVCTAHHRAIHHGLLVIDGTASTGFSFLHADGSNYGGAVSAAEAGVAADVFSVLRNLGFRESEARSCLAGARAQCLGADVSFDTLLRAALAALHASRHKAAGAASPSRQRGSTHVGQRPSGQETQCRTLPSPASSNSSHANSAVMPSPRSTSADRNRRDTSMTVPSAPVRTTRTCSPTANGGLSLLTPQSSPMAGRRSTPEWLDG